VNGREEFSKGETVRIKKGAFAAFAGQVVAVDYERARLKVRVEVKVRPSSDSQLLDLAFPDVEKVRTS